VKKKKWKVVESFEKRLSYLSATAAESVLYRFRFVQQENADNSANVGVVVANLFCFFLFRSFVLVRFLGSFIIVNVQIFVFAFLPLLLIIAVVICGDNFITVRRQCADTQSDRKLICSEILHSFAQFTQQKDNLSDALAGVNAGHILSQHTSHAAYAPLTPAHLLAPSQHAHTSSLHSTSATAHFLSLTKCTHLAYIFYSLTLSFFRSPSPALSSQKLYFPSLFFFFRFRFHAGIKATEAARLFSE